MDKVMKALRLITMIVVVDSETLISTNPTNFFIVIFDLDLTLI